MVRFHGRNIENWEKKGIPAEERFNYLYNEDELKAWVTDVRLMAEKADRVHVIFKNKFRDFSIRNAREFTRMLG